MRKLSRARTVSTRLLPILTISSLLIFSFQNCSPGFQMSSQNSLATQTPEIPGGNLENPPSNSNGGVIDGKALYAVNCQACHGPLAASTKLGRIASQISQAIAAVPEMKSIRLTAVEISIIAEALKPSAAVPVTTDLAADKYFSQPVTAKAPKRISRLTRDQIDKTVRSLLSAYTLSSIKTALPPDPLITNYEYSEVLNFDTSNFPSLKNWIESAVSAVRANPRGVVDCMSSNNSPTCLSTQSRAFITKAFRGDVTSAKLTELSNFYLDGVNKYGYANATANLADVVLSSPAFLFREEFDVVNGSELVAAEQLQLLSYGLADAPPEQLGLNSGNASAHLQPATKATTLNSILQSADARAKLSRFFLAWLEVKEPNEYSISTSVYPEFTPQLANSAVNETKKFLNYQLAKSAPSLKDITRSSQSFIDSNMAQLYGMSTSDPSGNSLIDLDSRQRFGIFSHASVIASHSGPDSSRIIKRGAFFARKVMCIPIAGTPPGVNTTLPSGNALTQRQKVEMATNSASCLGCHSTLNPLGFFQENFSASGKWRTQDAGSPINSSISYTGLDEGPLNTVGPVETLSELTASIMFKQCFIRQMFRYYVGRNETPSDDPVLKEMFLAFMANDKEDFLAALRVLANSNRLTQR